MCLWRFQCWRRGVLKGTRLQPVRKSPIKMRALAPEGMLLPYTISENALEEIAEFGEGINL